MKNEERPALPLPPPLSLTLFFLFSIVLHFWCSLDSFFLFSYWHGNFLLIFDRSSWRASSGRVWAALEISESTLVLALLPFHCLSFSFLLFFLYSLLFLLFGQPKKVHKEKGRKNCRNKTAEKEENQSEPQCLQIEVGTNLRDRTVSQLGPPSDVVSKVKRQKKNNNKKRVPSTAPFIRSSSDVDGCRLEGPNVGRT